MSKNPEEWESLYIVDHPILKHGWLWDHLKATVYPEALDPANIIINTEKIPEDKNIDKINERLRDLLAEVVSDMKSNMTFLAPLLAGIVVGLSAMITLILNKLQIISSMGGEGELTA